MKTERRSFKSSAFSLVEFLVIVLVIVVLAPMILRLFTGSRRPLVLRCLANLKQVGAGFIMWSEEHEGRFPWQVTTNNGGALEPSNTGDVASSFRALSNYFPPQSALVCPYDKTRRTGSNYASLSGQNISYFLNFDAVTNHGGSILSGDRHLQLNGQPLKPGLVSVSTNSALEWTSELHRAGGLNRGNLAFSDGHVGNCSTNLQQIISQQPHSTSRFVIP